MPIITNRPSQRLVDLVGSLGGTWRGYSAPCRCPVHEDRTPSLSLRQGDRGILVHCFAGCDPDVILRELDQIKPNQSCAVAEMPRQRRTANLDQLWSASIPIPGTPGEKYLSARGIALDIPDVRYHPRCPKGRSPLTVFKPTVMVAVRERRALRALQRIFLDLDAGGYSEKLMIGTPQAGAWQGSAPTDTLAITEGFEDAACYARHTGIPTWASLSAARLHLLAIPEHVKTIVIGEDNDPEGMRAAVRAVQAYTEQGFTVRRHSPRPYGDWAEVPIGS